MKFLVAAIAVMLFISPSHQTKLVKLLRLYNPSTDNHFYTTSADEATNADVKFGYDRENSPGYVGENTQLCVDYVRPVYRLYKSGAKDDHFYTMSSDEASYAAVNLGYIREGTAFYCVPPTSTYKCGATRALSRYSRGTDHFYTTDVQEGNKVVAIGGRNEGIMCWIWSSDYP